MASIESLQHCILAEILLRTPIRTIVYSKCVCKKWRSLVSESYFANMHLLRSPTCVVIHQAEGSLPRYDVFKLGELDNNPNQFNVYHDPVMKIKFGLGFRYSVLRLSGTVNGLTCVWHYSGTEETYICNPVTREYALLPDENIARKPLPAVSYGFGLSAARNQYKVVRFYQSANSNQSNCEVYTLGTGAWRSLGQVLFKLGGCQNGVFLNGNLHWLAYEHHLITGDSVCTFDLEKECSVLTTSAPLVDAKRSMTYRCLGVLGGCLCISDNTYESDFVVWVIHDYRMKACWTKEIVIGNDFKKQLNMTVQVLTFTSDGSILLAASDGRMFTYHCGNNMLRHLDISWCSDFSTRNIMLYVPSFIKLKTLMSERVSTF